MIVREGGKVANPQMLKSPHWRYWTRKVTVVDSETEAALTMRAEGGEPDPEEEVVVGDGEEMVPNDWNEVAEAVEHMQVGSLRDFKFISRK
jgi:hypothetical protein